MKRLLTFLLGLASVAAALASATPATRPSLDPGPGPVTSARPNLVVLVADDWGFTDLGAFGGEIETPHIDALALRGTRFSNFHTSASCSPTRSMLLTGVDNHLNGTGNLMETMPRAHQGRPGYLGALAPNVVTVATRLQQSGYRTYITGKWNVGSQPYNLPNRRGFDRSIVQGDTGSDNWNPMQRYLPHSKEVEWFEDGRRAQMPAAFYSSTYFVDRMLDYLRTDQGSKQPFFAYLGFQANHVPIQAPQALVDKYRGRYQSGWEAVREARRQRAQALGLIAPDTPMAGAPTPPRWDALSDKEQRYQARQMEVYAAMADAMDQEVGRLVAYLKASGQYDNTVFVFLSDNGAEASDYAEAQPWLWTQYSQHIDRLGGPGAYGIPGPGWASASVSPLQGSKFYAGEGGIRVPLVFAGVPGERSAQIAHALTHVTDIAPTLLELAGVEAVEPVAAGSEAGKPVLPMTGKSLLPLIRGQVQAVRSAQEPLGYELSGNLALFRGDFKLVRNSPPVGDGHLHLYNIRLDPGETQDLQATEPALFASMQRDYEAYAASHGVLPMPAHFSPARQVLINSLFNYWLPAYAPLTFVGLAWLACVVVLWRRRARQ